MVYGERLCAFVVCSNMEVIKGYRAAEGVYGRNMLESIRTRELSCIIREFREDDKAGQNLLRSREADVFVKHAGRITVIESHVTTFK